MPVKINGQVNKNPPPPPPPPPKRMIKEGEDLSKKGRPVKRGAKINKCNCPTCGIPVSECPRVK
jgi:hypothetical protein